MSSFMLSTAPILWLILVILLIVLEVATYQLVAIWFALGAAAALIVSLFELSGTVQIVVFIAVSALRLMAVSYTHLDVYKRQRLTLQISISFWWKMGFVCAVWVPTMKISKNSL